MRTPASENPFQLLATRLARFLNRRVDGASLAFFRIAFGLVFLWEVWRYATKGWIDSHFIDPVFHFHYAWFPWVGAWEGDGMYVHYIAMGTCALLMALGLCYRLAAFFHLLLFAQVFLIDQTTYLNHLYLGLLINGLLLITPAHRVLSLDAVLMPKLARLTGLRWLWPNANQPLTQRLNATVPAWSVLALQAQLGMVYLFAGIAKMNPDWLFAGEPIGEWLRESSDRTLFMGLLPIGDLLFTHAWSGLAFAWGGFLLDILAWPLLLWKRTRLWIFAALTMFHVTNSWLFNIGIFPWMAIAVTTIFFAPDWPRRLRLLFAPSDAPQPEPPGRSPKLLYGFLAFFFAVQVFLPFRHLLLPGDVHWSEFGHRFAWHMKLREKSGTILFDVVHPATGTEWEIARNETTRFDGGKVHRSLEGGLRSMLTRRQIRKMSARPHMLRVFIPELERRFEELGYADIEIYTWNESRLNHRGWSLLIDPRVNLADDSIPLKDWVLPYDPQPKPIAHVE